MTRYYNFLLFFILLNASVINIFADENNRLKFHKRLGDFEYYNGQVSLSGVFQYRQGDPILSEVCFFPDENSAQYVPRKKSDNRMAWFCFSNKNEAIKDLGISPVDDVSENICIHKGFGNILVDSYVVNSLESESFDTARLVKVISIEKDSKTICSPKGLYEY